MARYANGVRAAAPEEAERMSIATSEQAVVGAVTPRLFVGGEWREASGGGRFPVEDPSTVEVLCEVAEASPEQVSRVFFVVAAGASVLVLRAASLPFASSNSAQFRPPPWRRRKSLRRSRRRLPPAISC